MDTHVSAEISALREALATDIAVAVTDGRMCSHVTAECRGRLEACRTALTRNWLLSGMNALVQVPQMVVPKTLATRRAAVRSFLCVHAHVVAQHRALDEAVSTHGTDVWPGIGVDTYVDVQRALLREPTATYLTFVGTFTGMPAHVNHQGTVIAETFTAHQADVVPVCMQAEMFPIFIKAYESTPTHSTTVRRCFLLLLCLSDTCPYTIMSLKLPSRCKLLPADRTGEGLTIDSACLTDYAVRFWQYSNNINCRHHHFTVRCTSTFKHIPHSHTSPTSILSLQWI